MTVPETLPAAATPPLRSAADALGEALRLVIPTELGALWDMPPPLLAGQMYLPLPSLEAPSIFYAIAQMKRGAHRPPRDLVPLLPVDELSIACVVCARTDGPLPSDFGSVVRWHLGDIPARAQRVTLDVDARAYVDTIIESEGALPLGKQALAAISKAYHQTHGKANKIPRAHVTRPIRLASQNVVVGEAAWHYDARFDGLAVPVWQTAQEPHLNAHEATRALTAMMLAEAFRSGGTMEVRFDGHPEGRVPAMLRQWARVSGMPLGADAVAISPADARRLMVAATEMPAELRNRILALESAGVTPERSCYTLLCGIWSPIELDFLLGCSPRALEILRGGTDPLRSTLHLAELDQCRSAAMLGTLFQRLQNARGKDGRVIEGDQQDVYWSVLESEGAVRFRAQSGTVPWVVGGGELPATGVTVLPRIDPDDGDCALAAEMAVREACVAILTPQDVSALPSPEIVHLRHPDTRAALARQAEGRLLRSCVARQ